jgi:hypothetical protein
MEYSGGIAIITNCHAEFLYMVTWCEDMSMGTPFLGLPENYPFMVVVDVRGGLSGWLNKTDRNIKYVPFIDFLLNWKNNIESGEFDD